MSSDRGTGLADPPLPFSGGRLPNSESELAFVERRVMALYFVAPALSFAALAIGVALVLPQLAAAGVIGLGLTACAIGAYAIRERRLLFITRSFMQKSSRFVLYEGFAAVPFGGAALIGGVLLLVPAVLFLLGVPLQGMLGAVLARPGHALVPIGILLGVYGFGFLIGFVDRTGSLGERAFKVLLDVPGRIGGLILLFLGGLALLVGLYEWLRPEAFGQWVDEIKRGKLPLGL